MSLDMFSKFLGNPLLEFDTVHRYSGVPIVTPDNDVNHTYRVMMMGLIFVNNFKYGATFINKEKFIMRALLHDTPEIYISDVPRPVKHYSSDVEKAIKDIEKSYAEKLLNWGLKDSDIELIQNDKDTSPEGILLRVIDLIDVAYFSIREVEVNKNIRFLKVTNECLPCIKGLQENIQEYFNKGLITTQEKIAYTRLILDTVYNLNLVNNRYHDFNEKYNLSCRSLVTNH